MAYENVNVDEFIAKVLRESRALLGTTKAASLHSQESQKKGGVVGSVQTGVKKGGDYPKFEKILESMVAEVEKLSGDVKSETPAPKQ